MKINNIKKIVVIILVSTAFASCRKDRVCSCTYSDGTVYSESTYVNVTKKQAKALCTSNTQGISCALK